MTNKIHILFITCILLTFSCDFNFSQAYKIKITMPGLANQKIMLGYHFADKNYVVDTITLNNKGAGYFTGDKPLEKGIYITITPDKKYFEFLIDNDQVFEIETDTCTDPSDFIKKMKISGSDENKQFIAYQLFMGEKNRKAQTLRKFINDNPKSDSVATYKQNLTAIDKEVSDYWNRIRKENPASLLAALVYAITEIEVPDAPKDSLGRITDSTFQYRYYKSHYFDHFDFNDKRLLRTPVLHARINSYINRVLQPFPDSIINDICKVIDKSMVNQEVFQFVIQSFFNHYVNSNIMGYDAIYIALAERYYLVGKTPWVDSTFISKLAERVTKSKPNLLGKPAPELKLPTYDEKFASLLNVDATYTLVYFFDPDCGHCKKETPKVHEISQRYWDKKVRVFSVYTHIEKEKWLEYIDKNGLTDWINCWDPYNQSNFRNLYDVYSTPILYLLDKDKKIIAKRIDSETLEKILEQEFKQ